MIEVKNLVKRYGAKAAVDDISFSIAEGEVVGLLGLNGAGKSTTMNILTGCLAATSGDVRIGGVDIQKEPVAAKQKTGYLPEIPPLYLDMTVGEYLSFVYDLKGVRGKKAAQLAEVRRMAGIGEMSGRLIKNLSKGYRQRVGLAGALVGDPKLLILDEPTVGLDPTQIIEIRNLIGEMGKTRTVILSSHILSEVQAVCQRVIVLDKGKIVADDTPRQLEQAMQSRHASIITVEGSPKAVEAALKAGAVGKVVRLAKREDNAYDYRVEGKPGSDIRKAIFCALAKENLPLLAARSGEATLEDVFLRLVGAEGQAYKTGEGEPI